MSTSARRWVNRPQDSTWGDFGAEDQLGRLNLLTPEKVMQGMREVQEGRTFCLSLPLDCPGNRVLNPRRAPPSIEPTLRGDKPNMTYPLSRDTPALTDIICDDTVTLALQYSTQWDSLAHMGQWFDADADGVPEMCFYNGYRGGEDIVGPLDYRSADLPAIDRPSGAHRLGIENTAVSCVQGRGVMLDLKRHFGADPIFIGYDELMAAMDAQQVVVEAGDLLCLRTGMDEALLDFYRTGDATVLEQGFSGLDGRDEKLRRWIIESNVAALISDNVAVERLPARPCADEHYPSHPLHDLCLFRLGVHLGELWDLSELAQWLHTNGRNRFLLTAPPLRLPRAVGSPVTPVATV